MRYKVKMAKAPPRIDARPEDPAWEGAEVARIDQFPWQELDYYPKTEARIVYDASNLYLLFSCREKYIKATRIGHQTEVWLDNCVELFVSPSPDLSEPYFNFEFNCLGSILLGFGKERIGRTPVSIQEIQEIQCAATFQEPVDIQDENEKEWFLEVSIPLALFSRHTGASLPTSGIIWRANLNKCSESTKATHHSTWARVETKAPDFHRPEFFGELEFE